MLLVQNIKLTPDEKESALLPKAAKILRCDEKQILSLSVVRKSLDAREGIFFVYSVAAEVQNPQAVLKRCRDKRVSLYTPALYTPPAPRSAPSVPPVVVGAGPAGLFAALLLAQAGQKPILLERGKCADARKADVECFWQSGTLDMNSNVQFGMGGAGAFSDGKLNTGTRDVRHRYIMEQLVAFGAPADILTDAKPHVGTDKLHVTLNAMERQLRQLGADIRFGHRLVGIVAENSILTALQVEADGKTYSLPCRHCILALGHSARDTVEALYTQGVHMEAKPFAAGVRIEHRQVDMDAAQYKEYAGHPGLPPTSYKLSCHLPDGRGAFSFCVCPGGQVVAAASEEHKVVTNGMSEYARDKENINGAFLIGITPEDFGTDPLDGFRFQRQLEAAAFALGGGGYKAPCQKVEDFLLHRPTTAPGKVLPSYRPGVTYADLHDCLPAFLTEAMEQALPLLEKKLHGYAQADALLTAVESRSSSPVRIPRDDTYQCNVRGLYPCGEGAGYAGGILSAAADGMRCAEEILK